MKVVLSTLFVIFFAVLANAAGGGEGGDHSIPTKYILIQTFNFVLVVGLLVYLLRKKVAEHFSERRNSFSALLQKAETAKVAAEDKKKEVKERLAKLESTAEETRQRAMGEAENLRNKILSEAATLSERMGKDAERTAHYEKERAITELRLELLDHSMENSRQNLSEKMEENDLKRLQTEFVEKIQVAQQ